MTAASLSLTRSCDQLELTIDGTPRGRAPFAQVDVDTLAAIITDYHAAVDGKLAAELLELGGRLSAWLDSKSGWHTTLLESLQPPLRLEITTPRTPKPEHRVLLEAPWELLLGEAGFLAEDHTARYTPVRRIGDRGQPHGPRPGALSVLFMAAAPPGETELAFEEEEARILARTADIGLDLFVEDTGTARELGLRAAQLRDDPAHALHVLHISCHGNNVPEPLLMLEDEFGDAASTTVGQLCDALGGNTVGELGLLFSSACLTAAGGGFSGDRDSLALALTRAGVPAVLGWAASVFDESASRFAAGLYEQLARGDTDLEIAVSRTRWALLTDKAAPDPHWHLARLFLGPKGGGLLARPQAARRKGPPVHGGFLGGDGRSPVAGPQEFVGRRRLLQDSLRKLRGHDHAGLLLHGAGNLGKSSLAARVVDRMSTHETVVMYGRFDAWNLVGAIHDKLGTDVAAWSERWKHCGDAKIGEALRELFDRELTDASGKRPLLLVLDDFERMLVARESALHMVEPGSVPLMAGVVGAFRHASTRSRLLLTCRYKFTLLDDRGRELSEALAPIPLASFDEREANKRARREPDPAAGQDDLRPRCVQAHRGNPAVLALLLRLASKDPFRCGRVLDELEAFEDPDQALDDDALRELLGKIAASELVASLGVGDRELFRRSLMFEAPLPVGVAPLLAGDGESCDGDGERLIALGVWEEQPDVVGGRAFKPNPLVRAHAVRESLGMVDGDQQRAIAGVLVPALCKRWSALRGHTGDHGESLAGWEVVRLARLIGDWQVAADYGRLALAWRVRSAVIGEAREWSQAYVEELEANGAELGALLYRDVVSLHEHGAEGDFRHACIEHGLLAVEPELSVEQWGPLLFARANSHEGRGARAEAEADLHRLIGLYQGPTWERERAVFNGVLADILRGRGELDEALRILRDEQLPVYERLGDLRSRAMTLGQVADILRGRGELDEALRIRREELLPVYERLGDVRSRAVTLGQVADILRGRGELDEALRIRREEQLPVYERLGDVRSRAVTLGQVADILQARGELDEALRIRKEEELPVYERLGDVRSRAVALGQVADILQARGELDEALRIRREEELPVFERLGDIREQAVTLGRVADILQARGELDEALRIRREEQLPVYERLGDVRERALALGQVADILQARGELDEALRIRREEELPVYERLGDVRSRAVTLGQVADILQARGELDEALRIRKEEELPVYERLGDVRSRAVALGQVADILQARGELDEALRIRREEELPVFERLGDIREQAVTLGRVADILQARGELDEALRIRREEQLPVYERLGDVRLLLVGRTNVAIALLQRGRPADQREVVTLLVLALRDARRLRLPEAQQIANLVRQLGGDPDAPPFVD